MWRVSATMSQENACPTQVLILSTKSSSLCMVEFYAGKKRTPSGIAGWCSFVSVASGLLRRRLGCSLAEVVVVGHPPAYIGVEVPAHRALGERSLRLLDFDPHRVVLALLRRGIVSLELPLQDRVRRLVEAHLVLGLKLDVVLGIALDGLPGHVLRRRFDGVVDDRLHL